MCYCIQIYGPVVRLAPNELSFGDSTAWQDIYGETSAYVESTDDSTISG